MKNFVIIFLIVFQSSILGKTIQLIEKSSLISEIKIESDKEFAEVWLLNKKWLVKSESNLLNSLVIAKALNMKIKTIGSYDNIELSLIEFN